VQRQYALAAIAHAVGENLIHRAAEVHLKERRKLVVVPRETPLSLPQLKNMQAIHEAGAVVLPACARLLPRCGDGRRPRRFCRGPHLRPARRGQHADPALGRTQLMAATLRTYLELVRFSHTVFALPFAIMAALIAIRCGADQAGSGGPGWIRLVGGILLCMVSAANGGDGLQSAR